MENQFPIYLKSDDYVFIKVIDENHLLEINKHTYKGITDYRIESCSNKPLVNAWLEDLRDTDKPECIEVTKDEFVKNYFETVYKINEKLL